jgi:hypothetical protein
MLSFEPSTAHLHPRNYALTRMLPWVRCAADAADARAVHTPVQTSDGAARGGSSTTTADQPPEG